VTEQLEEPAEPLEGLAEQLEDLTGQLEELTGQLEEKAVEQLEILYHHRINHYLTTEEQEEDVCPNNKGNFKNWNSRNVLKFGSQKGSK
jgi:hypothetical protein